MKAINRLTHIIIRTRETSEKRADAGSAWTLVSTTAALVVVATLSLLFSCVDDDESPFARRPAFFRFSPVTAAPKTLLPALSSPGEWCTITLTTTSYAFRSATGMTDTYPQTQLDAYGRPTWVSGLIVGTPTVPELGFSDFAPVCYDAVCPYCFEDGGITRQVVFSDIALGRVSCTRCHHVYDINNGGIVIDGATSPHDPRLYRYRCHYNNDTFVVQN